jgi:hypothetical protein
MQLLGRPAHDVALLRLKITKIQLWANFKEINLISFWIENCLCKTKFTITIKTKERKEAQCL